MNIVEQFHAAWVFEAGWNGLDLLPTALSRAAAQVLDVDAAGISMMGREQRVPLGSSSTDAAVAERWQFTLGDGPCFAAYDRDEPVHADDDVLRHQWPALHDQLQQHTPFRSTVTLPLGKGAARFGVLDLYFTQPLVPESFVLSSAQVVASMIHTALLGASLNAELTEVGSVDRPGGPVGASDPNAWLDSPAVRERQHIWVAVGMCAMSLQLEAPDAFSLLRAHAYAAGRTLEDVADEVVIGDLVPEALEEPVDG